jgi:hypothetical protein
MDEDKKVYSVEETIEGYAQRVQKNHPVLEKYWADDLIWSELNIVKGGILNCFTIGCAMAGVTLTNYLLEWTMKLALIYNDVGFVSIGQVNDLDAYAEAHKNYSNENLFETINRCAERGLITDTLKDRLHKYRQSIRNGFSHASPKSTFKDASSRFVMFSFKDLVPSPVKETKISTLPPFLQAYAVRDFAEANALPYFDLVYQAIKEVEQVIGAKHQHPSQPKKS